MQIIPSLFTNDKEEFLVLAERIKPYFKRVQVDINDGAFNGHKTLGVESIKEITKHFLIDLHLMVDNPIVYLNKAKECGAFQAIGQIEHMESQVEFVKHAKSLKLKVGLAVDFPTSITEIDSEAIHHIDTLLLMAYPAGIGGQEFNDEVIDKIVEAKEWIKYLKLKTKICIDGGVWLDNIGALKKLDIEEVAIGRKLINGNINDSLKLIEKIR